MGYTFISPEGKKVRTKTVKEFSETYNLNYSHCRDLACGTFKRYKGWCSGHRRAKKARQRFLTVLVNEKEGKREILGHTVTRFAEKHGLCANEVYKLINCRTFIYRDWLLERTRELAQVTLAELID